VKRFFLTCFCAGLFALALGGNTNARAGGFQLNDHNARAIAMCFAVVTADGADASTLFYNPAGMSLLKNGFNLTIGGTLLMPGARFTGLTTQNSFKTTAMQQWNFPLPHAYAVYKLESGWAFGVGLFVPFGAGTRWDENWTGRNLAIRTYIETITINPNISYAFADNKIAVSGGVTYSIGKAQLQNRVINFAPEPFLNLEGSGSAISWNAGIIAEPVTGLRIGAAYRHNINMKYDGNAKFTLDAAGTQPLTGGLNNLFADGPGGTALNLPFDLRTGISYRFSEKFMAEIGFDYVGWSSYDTLRVNFNKAPGAPRKADGTDNPGVVINPRNYNNAPTFRAGAEFTASDALKLRAGAYYDVVPVDAQFTQPILPDANRIGVSVGAGIKISDAISVDAGYLFVYGLQREVKGSTFGFDGVYNSWANVASVSLTCRF
jgi:long-chain fatty acid transport protein